MKTGQNPFRRAWQNPFSPYDAHARAGQTRKLHEGAPRFEGFQTIQQIEAV